jgi:hypothetical protein
MGSHGQLRAALLILVTGSFVTVLAACGTPGTSGSGPTTSEVRSVDPFSRVEVGNGIGLTVHVGGAPGVEVLAEENILPLISATVEDGVLRIRATESFTTSSGVMVATSVSALDGISVLGGSQAQIEGLANEHFDITLSGGAGLAVAGRATEVSLDASGGAKADLAAFTVQIMSVRLSGGATADLSVSDLLTGTSSGAAVATVAGGAELDVQTSDSSRVTGTR